jgi:hypothetical protein
MFQERTLKVLLVLVGLAYVTGFLIAAQVVLVPYRGNAHEQMLGSVLGVLGIFLLLAVRDTPAHRSLIAFAAWSTVAHAAVMIVQAMRGVLRRGELGVYIPMLVIGIALIFLLPVKHPDRSPT